MGRLHIYRRDGETPHWQAQVYVGGKRYRFSCVTDDKPTARQYAQRRVQELQERHNRGLAGLPDPIRMSEVFERYEREYGDRLRPSSRERMGHVLAQARSWFVDGPGHDPQLTHVTPRDIQAFLEQKRGEGVSSRTVNLYRANLHRVFQLCVRPWLLIPTNPVAATEPLRQEMREGKPLSLAAYGSLRAECSGEPMLALFVTLAWETGGRTGELLQLEWADVDFERGQLTFVNDPVRGRQTKGRRSRTIPLSSQALNALRDHGASFRFVAPHSAYVFKHLRRSRDAEPGQRIERVYRGLKAAARRAKLEDFRPHDLRHSFTTAKLAAGVPAQLLMRYVGHTDLATTLRYAHLVSEHLRAVVEPERRAALSTASS